MSLPMQPHGPRCSTGQDLMTIQQLQTFALDAYSFGADGISAFNFQYYRPSPSAVVDACEGIHGGTVGEAGAVPPFSALAELRNPSFLLLQDQHWAWSTNWGSHPGGSRGEGRLLTPNITVGHSLGTQQFPYVSSKDLPPVPARHTVASESCSLRHRGWLSERQYP